MIMFLLSAINILCGAAYVVMGNTLLGLSFIQVGLLIMILSSKSVIAVKIPREIWDEITDEPSSEARSEVQQERDSQGPKEGQ